jgi:hypothetical protein
LKVRSFAPLVAASPRAATKALGLWGAVHAHDHSRRLRRSGYRLPGPVVHRGLVNDHDGAAGRGDAVTGVRPAGLEPATKCLEAVRGRALCFSTSWQVTDVHV